jgi:asparaginyl-tRNA synthetase
MNAYIEDVARHEGQQVTIHGWLHHRRSSGKIHFLVIRDGTGFIQAVMSKAGVDEQTFQAADHLSQETSLVVTGTVRQDRRAPGGY